MFPKGFDYLPMYREYPIQNANAEGLFRAEVIYPYTKGSYTVMAKISSNFLSESISHIILQAYH